MARTIVSDPLLAIARVIILVGQILMGIAAAALVVGLPLVIFLRDKATAEMRAEYANPELVFPALAVAAILIVALAIVVMAYFFLDRMRRIVETVGEGDPFQPQNGRRLTLMAWLMLGIQLLSFPAAAIAIYIEKVMGEAEIGTDLSLDFSGIILVVTLFILARVFRKGTEMRADLEGTV